jgi:rare lipoprotein A
MLRSKLWSAVTLSVAAAILLTGCAETQLVAHTAKRIGDATEQPQSAQPTGRYKVGKPYQIAGLWYYPKVDYAYSETGIASWYGPGFHGNETANGEVYDQNALTAAHRTLPMPSMVRVTNLENGRSLKLRVNDRGPFARGRIIDVSRKAADLLGFLNQGTAKVRVEVVEGESRRLAQGSLNEEAGQSAPDAAPTVGVSTASLDGGSGTRQARTQTAVAQESGGGSAGASGPRPDGEVTQVAVGDSEIFVQAGAFVSYDNASRLGRRLADLAPVRIDPARVADRQFYRVRLGPVADVDRADTLLAQLQRKGFADSQVVVVE